MRQEFLESNDCIPEVRESYPSPSQVHDQSPYNRRESLVDTPGTEGSIHCPGQMAVSTPFSAQSLLGN